MPEVSDGAFNTARDTLVEAILSLIGSSNRHRNATMTRIHGVLTALSEVLLNWANTSISEAAQEADNRAFEDLADFADLEISEDAEPDHSFVALLIASFRDAAMQALASIDHLASLAARATSAVDLLPPNQRNLFVATAQAGEAKNAEFLALQSLRRQLLSGIVRIIGRNGQAYFFDLDYYMQLIQTQALARADSSAILARAALAGVDLVVVSPNPSTIGDYCDAYRGKVFSISGADVRFPKLADTPNGGPPFHPHCHHWLGLYDLAGKSEADITAAGNVDRAYLLQGASDSANRIWRDWNARSTNG